MGLTGRIRRATGPFPKTVTIDIPVQSAPRAGPFRMYTLGGADQIARDMFQIGWHAFERPLPDVFAACVSQSHEPIIDIGANTGFYSLVAARASNGATIHAFEPYSIARAHLKRNLRLNGMQRQVKVVNAALSDASGAATFYIPKQDHGLVETSGSLNGGFKEEIGQTVEITTLTLDEYASSMRNLRVGVMKIDVESAEHRVLLGAERVIADSRPLIFLEVLPQSDNAKLEEVRTAHNYTVARLQPGSIIVSDRIDYDPLAWNQMLMPSELISDWLGILAGLSLNVVRP